MTFDDGPGAGGGERVEDRALLGGRGRFIDDLPVPPRTLHAAILRSPHAHARLGRITAPEGVRLFAGPEIAAGLKPFIAALRTPMRHFPVATGKVRYVGEPVAVVLAEDRYRAEDALELVAVEYEPLPAVVSPSAAIAEGAPLLHEAAGTNLANRRRFSYGDPEGAFAAAEHRIAIEVGYPRSAVTPIECFGLIAAWDPDADAYEVTAPFQGPFALHPVMAAALGVPANRLRLRTPPDSGGSFGIKQGLAPYIVLMAAVARLAGRPVKWIEDRLEHLTAAGSATNRETRLEAAVMADGRVTALRYRQLEDCGAYIKAPEPATLYRMHGAMTGAYDIANLEVENSIAVTNKTPSGLNRGFGGPQVYFALERLMHRIADRLGLDRLEVLRRNLVKATPYRTASGALYDSGDFGAVVDLARPALEELRKRRAAARAEGRLYGVGLAAAVEPTVSNMGYITTVLDHEQRLAGGLKNGALAAATVAIDPHGGVTVTADSVPQGQGHRTVLAEVVAGAFGLAPAEIRVVTEFDSARDAWSIAAGNYSCRFAPAVAGTAWRAASALRGRLARLAAARLDLPLEDIRFEGGAVGAGPGREVPFARLAGLAHWSPGALPQGVEPALRATEFWSPPELGPPDADDCINGSAAYGFVFDVCGVEVDAVTGRVRIDRYVTAHDAGRLLHRPMADGQVRGSLANAVGAALFEAFVYDEAGQPLAGTFADYPPPTACETPDPEILHLESPSPFTPLGAKGIGEGNAMSAPPCIANAVADALGADDLELPLTPARVAALLP